MQAVWMGSDLGNLAAVAVALEAAGSGMLSGGGWEGGARLASGRRMSGIWELNGGIVESELGILPSGKQVLMLRELKSCG